MSAFGYGQEVMWQPPRGQKPIKVKFIIDCAATFPYSKKDESVIFMYTDNRSKVVSSKNLSLPTRKYRVVFEVVADSMASAVSQAKTEASALAKVTVIA